MKQRRQKSSPKSGALSFARGRPKAEAVAAISAAIMAAATNVFQAVGFEEASMDAIATRAGVTKVTLYKRFPDKRSLLRAVLQERRARWTHLPPTSMDLEKRLKHYAAVILVGGISAEVRVFHNLVMSAWPNPDEMAAREDVLGYNEMREHLKHEIRSGGQKLGISSASASVVATALMSMLSGWFEHRPLNADKADATKFAHKAVELLIHGKAAW